ncbi:MAG: hypothetical protein IT458_03825, partial [Planctomycetes bacterium]|nr:hypothetical protein [Planctomycetota bacterium]
RHLGGRLVEEFTGWGAPPERLHVLVEELELLVEHYRRPLPAPPPPPGPEGEEPEEIEMSEDDFTTDTENAT